MIVENGPRAAGQSLIFRPFLAANVGGDFAELFEGGLEVFDGPEFFQRFMVVQKRPRFIPQALITLNSFSKANNKSLTPSLSIRTSIFPVTAPEIKAVRYSFNFSIPSRKSDLGNEGVNLSRLAVKEGGNC